MTSFLQLDTDIALARVSYAALILLISGVNTALTAQDTKWSSLDSALAAAKGVDDNQVTSNPVLGENFYFGHRPSLIEAATDRYPNVCAMGYRSTPSTDQGDHYQGHNLYLGIEAMVIDGPYSQSSDGSFNSLGEEAVNRKVQRMLEAINFVIETNSTLGGTFFEITAPPSTLITECLRKRAVKGHGNDYYWQMCRLDYTVNKTSASHQ